MKNKTSQRFDKLLQIMASQAEPLGKQQGDNRTSGKARGAGYAVDATRAKAVRLKRETRNVDIIEICDAVLALTSGAGCEVCAARRKAKAATQARWRRNRGARS